MRADGEIRERTGNYGGALSQALGQYIARAQLHDHDKVGSFPLAQLVLVLAESVDGPGRSTNTRVDKGLRMF